MKKLIKISLIVIFALVLNTAYAQKQTKAEKKAAKEKTVKNKIDSVKYTFNANFMIPLGANGQRAISGNSYDLQISKDTVKAYLPYFGRAYMGAAIMNSTDGALRFTSTKFDYSVAPKKKGGWIVTIKFKDTPKANTMVLEIFENGSATLLARSNYRDAITFYGDIDTGNI